MDELTKNEMFILLRNIIYNSNLIDHNISSFNQFIENGLSDIITNIFKIEDTIVFEDIHTYRNKKLDRVYYNIELKNVRIKKPKFINVITGDTEILTPYMARKKNLTYSSEIYIDAKVELTFFGDNYSEVLTHTINNIPIGTYPVMVKSSICNIYKATREELINVYKEDPNDLGGYYIINGVEWCIDSSESVLYNYTRIYNNQYQNELTRSSFISKPGDGFENSREIILKLLNNKLITVRFVGGNEQYEELDIPFYIIYRIYGVISDQDIFKYIIFDLDDTQVTTRIITEYLMGCRRFTDKKYKFNHIINMYDQAKLITELAKMILKKHKLDDIGLIHTMLGLIDNSLLPHIGIDGSDKTRKKKLLFLGTMIRKLILTNANIINETDRNSYNAKRVHSAGISYSKSFKTIFRSTVVASIKKQFRDYIQNTSNMSDINIQNIFNKVTGYEKLEDAIEKSIKTGNKEIVYDKNSRPVSNRISSQMLNRKNMLNVLSTLRVVHSQSTSASNQTKQALEMRSVHPSYIGFVCVTSSADTGEKVGMSKQLAITAKITSASSSIVLHDFISAGSYDGGPGRDSKLQKIEEFLHDPKPLLHKTTVYINGDLKGVVDYPYEFLKWIKKARLNRKIDKYTTIVYNILLNEIHLWVDYGRLIRPLVKVYNNIEDVSDKVEFKQYILLTKYHIKKLSKLEISINDLENEGIVEYISAEEQENTLLAYNIEEFYKNQNNIERQYTHVDMEETIFGITALTSPFLNHTQPSRGTYQTNQAKQSCGWFILNPEHRYDKKKYFQIYNEKPLVKTITDDFNYPNGQNLMVAMMCYTGYNQEDSTIINRSVIDNGYFAGYMYSQESIKITDMNTEFIRRIRPSDNVKKSNADYRFLDEKGIIKIGTVIDHNTVLVCRLVLMNRKEEQYVDRSLIYHGDEPMEVDAVDITYYNPQENKIELVKVRLKAYRYLVKGDKLSTRSGNKNIVSSIMDPSEMPFTKTGIIPDMIVNPHSIPTRMVIGQLIESVLAKLYTHKGKQVDGTAFTNIDLKVIQKQLEGYGANGFGLEEMYCGKTGQKMKALIFFTPVFIQRLQKFAIDEVYSVSHGPIDQITFNPVDGKSRQGGLRLGEMEKDVLATHGAISALKEKFIESAGSDSTPIYVCRNCGSPTAIVNKNEHLKYCDLCKGDGSDIVQIDSTRVTILLTQYLKMIGIDVRFNVE